MADRRHPTLQQMVRLCQESLKCDSDNAVEFAAAFADQYGEELKRLEIALLGEIEAERCDTPP